MCLPEGERDSERAMALEAVVYPQPQDPFGFGVKDFYNYIWDDCYELSVERKTEQLGSVTVSGFLENQRDQNNYPNYGGENWNYCSASASTPSMMEEEMHILSHNNIPSSEEATENNKTHNNLDNSPIRPKRRRARSRKNKQDIENQRMTHIAVERNRRKQMNEYLSVLRSLMPDSYVQRGDQASIIGGAINFVKELEQRVQFLGAQKETDQGKSKTCANKPFSEFFSFPQYSTSASASASGKSSDPQVGEVRCGIADIEVTMVESHANLKIRSKKRPKQLLMMVSSLHSMRLTILHLNVTTTGEIVLYSLSVKVEDDCKLGSVDEIATAVYQMLEKIQQEASQC